MKNLICVFLVLALVTCISFLNKPEIRHTPLGISLIAIGLVCIVITGYLAEPGGTR